jgi:hypothetical protein
MNKDIICLIALKCEVETIRNLLLVSWRFYKILNDKNFLISKIKFDYPGVRKEWRTKKFYFELKRRKDNFLPIIKTENNYVILHEMFKRGVYKDICLNNELIYGICNDVKTFETLFEIFFRYLKGNPIHRKPSHLSWPNYYSIVIQDIGILKTGF